MAFEFGRHQLPPCRAALQNFVGSLPSLNRWRAVFLHTPRTGSNPLSEQTSSMNVPSPLGMELMAAGVTGATVGDGFGDGFGDGLGDGSGFDDFAIWWLVLLISGCLAGALISAFGVVLTVVAPDVLSGVLPDVFPDVLTDVAPAGLPGVRVDVLATDLWLCFRSVTVRGLVATCGRGGGFGLGVTVVVVVLTASSEIGPGVGVVLGAVPGAILGIGLGAGLKAPSRWGIGGGGVGDGFGLAVEPKPETSFTLEPKVLLSSGAVSSGGRGLVLRASGGSGIIRGSSPPTSVEVLASPSAALGVGAERGETPSELEDGSERGIEKSGSAWGPLGSVPFRKISRRAPDDSPLRAAPVAGSISQTTRSPGSSKFPPSSGRKRTARIMKSAQIGAAMTPPVNPMSELSSNPTHTTQTGLGV